MPVLTEADTCRKYVLPKLYAGVGQTTTSTSSAPSPMAASLWPATEQSAANKNELITSSVIALISLSESLRQKPITKSPPTVLAKQWSTRTFLD